MINCSNPSNADVILLSAPYGGSFSQRGGADKGPAEVIRCLKEHLEEFDRFTCNEPDRIITIAHHELENLNAQTSQQVAEQVRYFFATYSDKFICMLGGSHTVSIGAFHFFSEFYDPGQITILQIDAHPDLRDNPSDYKPSTDGFDHCCVMRRAYEMNFRTVQIGIRTISKYDYEFITTNKLCVFEWGRDKRPSVGDIIDSIKTDNVYLTIDIDGLDPSYAPATGTPVPGGLEWDFTLSLIRRLVLSKNLIGADIVEVAPIKDNVLTEYVAAHLCYNIVSYKTLKDKGLLQFYE